MGKFGVIGVFVVVCVAHFLALQSHISKQKAISKPKAKAHHITLSSVIVKKPVPVPPKPKVEPIILPPDPEPIVKPKPKPKPKPKRKKRVKKPKIVEPVVVPEPIIKEVIQEPIIEQVVAPVVTVDTSSIMDAYKSEIRRQIRKNLFYPKMAKRLRMQGIVQVAFCVLKNGEITDIKVLNNPKKLLGKGAMKTLNSLSLRPIPSELNEQSMDIKIPIEFKLIKG